MFIYSPQKLCRSPSKLLMSPRKNLQLPSTASPQRRILESPKEQAATSIGSSPKRIPLYKLYSTLAEKESFPLPQSYRHLAEIFRCVDTVYPEKATNVYKLLCWRNEKEIGKKNV